MEDIDELYIDVDLMDDKYEECLDTVHEYSQHFLKSLEEAIEIFKMCCEDYSTGGKVQASIYYEGHTLLKLRKASLDHSLLRHNGEDYKINALMPDFLGKSLDVSMRTAIELVDGFIYASSMSVGLNLCKLFEYCSCFDVVVSE
ncbi:hypothetical protein D3C81_1795800 [compost metagenome]